ncbi:MAG: small acid-soluble spore protein Tlp [Tissierella sp.]|uniref:small acid-soluble spore protein Tlp n=1 Tax=Tissierella sp. TaxID=41274 RepID=UPI003F97D65D
MKNKANPDDRSDNVEKLQFSIDNTIKNYREAEQMMSITDNEQTRQELKEKNKRRKRAVEGLREEIKDEANARNQQYK